MSPREKSLETCMDVVNARNYFQSPAERELFLLFLIGRLFQLLEEVKSP
jgi:hypothetical protein